MEVSRGSHVEEETKRSDKIVGRTKNEDADGRLYQPLKPSYICHDLFMAGSNIKGKQEIKKLGF